MKKLLQLFFGLFLCSSVIAEGAPYGDGNCYSAPGYYGDPCCYNDPCCDSYVDAFTVDVKYAAFFPLNSRVSNIYGWALPQFTLEGNVLFCKSWAIWLDGSYIFGNGHAVGGGSNKTHLSLVPITLGVKYFFPVCASTDFYVGLGASYSFLNTRDHSDYVHEKTSSNHVGGIVKTGFIYYYCDGFFLEGFLNYMYQQFYFPKTTDDPFVYRNDVDLSSLQLGIGIGWTF